MIYAKIKIGIVLLLFSGGIQAQQTLLATGGEAGSVSYSIGQIFYINSMGPNGSVTPGVQQPFGVFVTSGKEIKDINLTFTVYPNPTSDLLFLQVDNFPKEKLTYQLFDLQGKLLEQNQVLMQRTSVNLQNMPRSTYYLKVSSRNQTIKTFKIIKTQ